LVFAISLLDVQQQAGKIACCLLGQGSYRDAFTLSG